MSFDGISVTKKAALKSALFVTQSIPRIFVYHRFCGPDDDSPAKMDSETFEWQVRILAETFNIITFGDYLQAMLRGDKLPHKSVVLTVDDGYFDFYQHAYPVLRKYGVPATFFVTTGLVNQDVWLWPDKIAYAIETSGKAEVSVVLGQTSHTFSMSGDDAKQSAWDRLCTYCIASDDLHKSVLLDGLEDVFGIELPPCPVPPYTGVTWEQLKEMSDNGIEVGNHTATHPLLSKLNPENLDREIAQPKALLERKLNKPVVSFCYPNSRPEDVDGNVIRTVQESGHIGSPLWGGMPWHCNLFAVPRMGLSRNKTDFLNKLYGREYLGLILRGRKTYRR